MSNNKVMDQIKKILDNHLELKKQRKTPERYAILEEIYNFNHHFDADELYHKMKKSKFSVIPEKYKYLHNEVDTNKDGKITNDEIKKAQDILYKANIQQNI